MRRVDIIQQLDAAIDLIRDAPNDAIRILIELADTLEREEIAA